MNDDENIEGAKVRRGKDGSWEVRKVGSWEKGRAEKKEEKKKRKNLLGVPWCLRALVAKF